MRSFRPLRWTALALLCSLGVSCGDDDDDGSEPETPAERAPLPTPDLRLLVLTDLDGTLEPCGCTSRPLGGIDRLAARVKALSEEAPSVFVAAGDLFLGHEGHAGPEGQTQEIWRAETLASVLTELEMAAAAPGPRDLRLGAETFAALRERAGFPVLAAGTTLPADSDSDSDSDSGTELPRRRILEVAGVKVGLFGVSDLGRHAESSDPLEAARAEARALREAGAELVVALTRLDRRQLRDVGRIEGVDFVVRAGFDQAEVLPPAIAGDGVLLHAGRQGQHLLVVDLYRPTAEGDWADVSQWSVDVARRQLEEDIAELQQRLGGDESNPRLVALQAELAGLRAPELPESGPAFSARAVALDPDAEQDPAVRRRLEQLDIRINDHNQEAYADRTPPPVAEGEPRFVGSARCQSCHQPAFEWWRGHPHGRAYETLTSRHKEFHLECVGCHVTGYELPGGSTVTHNLDGALVDVGCEVCHGPGSQHIEAPETHNIRRDASERLCTGCHNEEHSDLFQYDAYRATLLVPGHGRPEGP